MTHLPECAHDTVVTAPGWTFAGPCICPALRACENRVRLHESLSSEQAFRDGREAGLDAAREATIRALTDDDGFVRQSELDDVLEYIDALREEQK